MGFSRVELFDLPNRDRTNRHLWLVDADLRNAALRRREFPEMALYCTGVSPVPSLPLIHSVSLLLPSIEKESK